MSLRKTTLDITTYIKGINTEASPLIFPDNASVDESNFLLLRDGSRKRRLGLDYEDDYAKITKNIVIPASGDVYFNSYNWSNAGGLASNSFLVIQIGNVLDIFSALEENITNNLLYTYTNNDIDSQTEMSMSSVNGSLVITDGTGDIKIISYIDEEFTVSVQRISTRDLFGVSDIDGVTGVDLTNGDNVSRRASTLTDNHLYNLRNQGWGKPVATWGGGTTKRDPISEFIKFSSGGSGIIPMSRSVTPERPKRWVLSTSGYTGKYGDTEYYISFTEVKEGYSYLALSSGDVYLEHIAYIMGESEEPRFGPIIYEYEYIATVKEGQYLFKSDGDYVVSNTPIQVNNGVFPSNADIVSQFIYPDAEDDSGRTLERFNGKDAEATLPQNMPAPKGSFIIDLLNRGSSRIDSLNTLREKYSGLNYQIVEDLPLDYTTKGASCSASYAGRMFYAGFSGDIIDGDSHSPSLSGYVFYSGLVKNISDITKCYQVGDPSDKESSELLDTDGGFIKIDGVNKIIALRVVNNKLIVFGNNGIWSVQGGSDYGFTATNHLVLKISDRGVLSSNGIVVVDSTLFCCCLDGIYLISNNQVGDLQINSITQSTIQSIYNEIDFNDKLHIKGVYDNINNEIKWVYRNRFSSQRNAKELILNLNLNAFTINTLFQLGENKLPLVVTPIKLEPFTLSKVLEPVVYNGEQVTYNGENVVYNSLVSNSSSVSNIGYVVVTNKTNGITYTVSQYKNENFIDWVSEDLVGVDAEAYIVTGHTLKEIPSAKKIVPYIKFYFKRTEKGYYKENDEIEITNQTSCLVKSKWEVTSSQNSGRWGQETQAYRYRRLYIPENELQEYNEGFELITTNNKLRGYGSSLSLNIKTEPNKDLHLLGWTLDIGVITNASYPTPSR